MHFNRRLFAAALALTLLASGGAAGAQSRDQKIADELATRRGVISGTLQLLTAIMPPIQAPEK